MSQIVRPQASLVYNVIKQEPELLSSGKPTPYEFKELSDIDDQKGLRLLVPGIQFYRSSSNGLDPVKVIREALQKVLVLYYPLAGRLREREDGRLVVECNGEGIMFIEADADVTLAEFGEPLCPPFHFPIMDELFCDSYDIDSVLDYPLFLIQVTRLRCGGFIIAHKINHIVCDGSGLAQFMQAVAEVARGAEFPSVHPVWKRELLQARNPPQINYEHREYDVKDDGCNNTVTPFVDVVHKSFFFGPSEMAAIRRFLPTHLKSASTFEVLSACIWRSRSISLQLDANEEVRFRFFANTRHKFNNPPLPKGYYGNVIVTPVAISTAEELSSNPLGYALTLIKSAKANVTEDYTKSLADYLVSKNRPRFSKVTAGTYAVSDVSRVRLDQWDFGWGTAVFGGPAKVWSCGPSPGFGNYFLGGKNSMGEIGTVVPMWLPRLAMDRFVEEINGYLSVVIEQPFMTFRSSIVNERQHAICT